MKSLFQSLGADEKEMDTFLTMLELGAQPVSTMAKYVGVPRSSMYVILERLKKLNLVEEFERNGIRYVKCIPVEEIGDLLRLKERNIQQSLTILTEKESALKKLENRLSIAPKVKFYEGKQEMMKMYEQILKEKEFCAFFNPEKVKTNMPEYHFKIPEMIHEKGRSARELVVDCPAGTEYQKLYHSPQHQIKILPHRYFEADTIITKDKLYMAAYGEKEVSGVEIHSQPLARSEQVLFDALWESVA